MAVPTFETFSLQDSTYITKSIQYRNRAKRKLKSLEISRRLGKKFISQQIQEKVIQVSGIIKSDTSEGLQTAVDNLQKNLSTLEGALVIESGRTYTATAERIEIPERTFTRTMVPFDIQFVCATPYAKGIQEVASFLIPSGTQSFTLPLTISGTVENRIVLDLLLPSGTGISAVNTVEVQNQVTANTLTVSGALTAETNVVLNYDSFIATEDGNNKDYSGQFDPLDPGSNTLIITLSGNNDGTVGTVSYNPRYW